MSHMNDESRRLSHGPTDPLSRSVRVRREIGEPFDHDHCPQDRHNCRCLAATALVLAGCSGGNGDAASEDGGGGAEAATAGLFTSTTDGADSYMALIDGEAITLVDTGTLNESRSMATWDEEGGAPVSVESDTVVLDNTFNASNSYDEIAFTTAGSAEDVAGLMCG